MKIRLPKAIKKTMYAAYVINFLLFAVAVMTFILLQPEIPLFYSLARNEDQLVSKIWVFIFPIISLAINVLHTGLMSIDAKKEVVLLSLFARITTVLQIALLMALLRIIYITI
jgi:hypothetical protein